MDERVRGAAREAERSTAFRRLARGGYVATGIVHALIGLLVILLVVRFRERRTDQVAALDLVESVPGGVVLLWGLAALLWALGAFHAAHGFALRRRRRRDRWGRRLAEWGQAAAYAAMGGLAAAVAFGARPNPDESAEDASRGLLGMPGGAAVLALLGTGIVVAGAAWIVMGARRSFSQQMRLPSRPLLRFAVVLLGVLGFIVKGAALVTVGLLVLDAAIRHEPQSAGALDAAVDLLRALPFGAALITVIGAGFLAYGAFCGLRAYYAELPTD